MQSRFIEHFFQMMSRTPQEAMLKWQQQQLLQQFEQSLDTFTPSDPAEMNYPVIWAMGAARLYQCAPKDQSGPVLLIVPSMNQKAHMYEALVDELANSHIQPFLLDWGGVSSFEINLTLDQYHQLFINPIIEHLKTYNQSDIHVMGCQLSGPLILQSSASVDKVIMHTVPWDFSNGMDWFRSWLNVWGPTFCQTVESLSVVSPNLLMDLFYELSPHKKQLKAAMGDAPYPLAPKVLSEILLRWIRENSLVRQEVMVKNQSLILTSSSDIFPEESMRALTKCLPNGAIVNIGKGQVLQRIVEFIEKKKNE